MSKFRFVCAAPDARHDFFFETALGTELFLFEGNWYDFFKFRDKWQS